ncbi:MAG: hypothetical protein KA914_00570 [Ottowia sp.]|nr:hypothetical protein [Ottowia sp.]
MHTISTAPRRKRWLIGALLLAPVLVLAAFAAWTDHEIDQQAVRIVAQAERHAPPALGALDGLPAPVARYLRLAVRESVPSRRVEIEQQGDFRRPKTEAFNPTTARQIIATGSPAMLFDATTWVFRPLLWARAYDAYADGQMTMKAKVLSAVAVVDEMESPELNQISLRRWLLESPLYPVALLPGGPVTWEPMDDRHARARVSAGGLQATLVATFGADGLLQSFHAEEDGDLNTPYHGSGEHVQRSDYQPHNGMLIPMRFTISRKAGGQIQPFWRGSVTQIRFL